MKVNTQNKDYRNLNNQSFQNAVRTIFKPLTARLRKENRIRKLKILKQKLEHIIKKLTEIKDFVFADPLLPFGTIWEATANLAHLVFADTRANAGKNQKS